MNFGYYQALSQEFAMWGLFRRCKIKLKRITLGIGPVLCPKLGEDQYKKRSSPRLGSVFCHRIPFKSTVKVVTFSMPIGGGGGGGLFSLLLRKSVSKVLKQGILHTPHANWGGGENVAPPPPPPPPPPPSWLRYCYYQMRFISQTTSVILSSILNYLRNKVKD